jgi:FkbM family methyltransferase
MKRLIFSIVSLAETLRQISHLQIEDELKIKIRKTYLWAMLLRRFDPKNRIVNVAGHNMKYCTHVILLYLFNEIFINQEYLFNTESRCPFIIDCGSNIGMSVLYFKLIYPDSEIIAFEPDEDAFMCLKINVEMNDFDSVSINQKALSESEGEIDFYYDKKYPGSLLMSSIRERLPKSKRKVEAVRLSTYINKEVDFLKMDIEGAELSVIEELSNAGKLNYIKQMVIEYHHHIIREDDVLSRMLQLLENSGFGYQIGSSLSCPLNQKQFQDILIYAYHKENSA